MRSTLSRRFGDGVNEFWLSHDEKRHPTLSILVNRDEATLVYIPARGDPGFTSRTEAENQTGGFAEFFVNTPTEFLSVSLDAVVPIKSAIRAAREFFLSDQLPASVQWLRL